MKRILPAALAVLMTVALFGCGGEAAVKPSPERTKAETALTRVAHLFDTYTSRDMDGVMASVSKDYKGGYGEFMSRIRKDMGVVTKVEMNYDVERIEIMKDTVGVSVKWSGKWYPKDGKAVEGRGESFLVFKDTDEMPLYDIVGDNPFGIVW